ncbi:MAG TPA: amidohydrolase family protein [Thermodesulfovibrionales bacterium]|nr:amidohydrolase family protein [Thermodesulfovibrionales bacterium]
MKGIIDFHTHAFPDALAERAMRALLEEGQKMFDVRAYLDGRLSSLMSSMDKNNVEKSIVCSIATKPSQFDSIMSWSKKIMSDRIVPFPSFHPCDERFAERISRIRGEGFKGIKFHPYYQDVTIDDERIYPVYEKILNEKLIVVMHTGFDLAFERKRIADPVRIARVLERFPGLKLVTTHFGAWEDWDNVERFLIGKEIYMEISYSLEFLNSERARDMILRHPAHCVLFGTDSPWTDQGNTLSLFKGLQLGEELEGLILKGNAENLLKSV